MWIVRVRRSEKQLMTKIWGLGALLLSCGVGAMQFACSSGVDEGTGVVQNDHKMDDLIGSVPVNSKSLDGIGSLALIYNYNYPGGSAGYASTTQEFAGGPGAGGSNQGVGGNYPGVGGNYPGVGGNYPGVGGSGGYYPSFYPNCTGTLISKNSVLTSRSCAQMFEQTSYGYYTLQFAIGADPTQSSRRINVVDVEYAPALEGGTYPDIGVLHLAESVTNVATFPVSVMSDDMIGKPFAAVGFGNSDLTYRSGTRRAGSLTLHATSGLLYPLIFDSFDAFYDYVTSSGQWPIAYDSFSSGSGGASSGSAGSSARAGSGGGFDVAGAGGGFQSAGSGGWSSPGTAGGGGNDWYREYLQSVYDNTQLAPSEAYLGGALSDAQPCGADQGGPLVRKAQGQVRVFGVHSRNPFSGCEKGAVYARVTAEIKAFIDAAAQWTDPCNGLSTLGKCMGTNATRCSTVTEGKRRVVSFDCNLLNQVCVAPGTSEVTCTDK
jgi:hypothetical protein